MTETKHRFDWHAEPEGSFLKWLMIHVVGDAAKDKALYERLSEATGGFSRIELGITVNGVEADAKAFVDHLEWAFERAVEDEARKLIEGMPRLHQLFESVHAFEEAFKEQVRRLAAEAGVEMREDLD